MKLPSLSKRTVGALGVAGTAAGFGAGALVGGRAGHREAEGHLYSKAQLRMAYGKGQSDLIKRIKARTSMRKSAGQRGSYSTRDAIMANAFRDELEKVAFMYFGADDPTDYHSYGEVPYEVRRKHFGDYAAAKAQEEATSHAAAMIPTALVGALPGAASGSPLGMAIGAAVGAAFGAVARQVDMSEIRQMRLLARNPDARESEMGNRLRYQSAMRTYNTERKHQEMVAAIRAK